jgi:hypothetical protein
MVSGRPEANQACCPEALTARRRPFPALPGLFQRRAGYDLREYFEQQSHSRLIAVKRLSPFKGSPGCIIRN